jgi:hypothetical protein
MMTLKYKTQSVGRYGEMNFSTCTLPVVSEQYANFYLDEVAQRATILEVELMEVK